MLTRPLLLLVAACLLAAVGAVAAVGCKKPSGDDHAPPSGSAAPAPSWVELSSPEGRFSVLLLAGAKQEKSHTKKPEGQVSTVSYLISTPEGRAYAASYTDYPPALLQAKSPDQLLDGARDGAASRVQGELLSEKKVAMDSAAGRELLIAGKEEPLTVRMRMAMVEGRLYMLQAIVGGPLHDVPDPDADRFFDSFRLAKK